MLPREYYKNGYKSSIEIINRIRDVWFILVVLSLVSTGGIAQDPVFSQFYNAPLTLNPAFVGNIDEPVFHANYRNQWPGFGAAYETYSVSYDQFFSEMNSGLGFMVLSDDAGDGILKNLKFSANYSYRLAINDELQLKMGLEAAFGQSRLDWNKLIFGEQLDPSSAVTGGGTLLPNTEDMPADLSNSYIDFGTGLLLFGSRYYAGISIKHINRPNTSFLNANTDNYVGLPLRFTIQAGGQLNFDYGNKTKSYSFLSPNVLYVRQGALSQLNIGAIFGYNVLELGAWFRHDFSNSDAVIGSVGATIDQYRFVYSFDYTISRLSFDTSQGSHEVGLVLNLGANKSRKPNLNDCFSIFR